MPSASNDMTVRDARALLRRLIDEAVAERSDSYLLVEDNYNLQQYARTAASLFGADGGGRSQMKKLEQVALSAQTFGDILNYIKNQTGRTTKTGELWRQRRFGQDLHDMLWNVIPAAADNIGKDLYKGLPSPARKELERDWNYDHRNVQRTLRLRLAQAYVRHLVAHYTYLTATQS